jgi:hypothetical protein
MQPLRAPPCPASLDLTTCSLAQLQLFVSHCVSLERRWTSRSTRPVVHHQFKLPNGFTFWAAVCKGSDFVLIRNRDTVEVAFLSLVGSHALCSNFLSIGEILVSQLQAAEPYAYILAMSTAPVAGGQR